MNSDIEILKARARRIVTLDEFKDSIEPIKVCNLGTLGVKPKEQKVLRMPIRVDGGEFLIPSELQWTRPAVCAALRFQRDVIGIEHPFCYVTVRNGLVDSTTDDHWHVDGFSTKLAHLPEQNYIWCHSKTYPTQYLKNFPLIFPQDFDSNKHNIVSYAHKKLQEASSTAVKCSVETQTLYCMDPYVWHRRPPESSQYADVYRNFLRISFVGIEINDINNTQNPLIPRTYTKDGLIFRSMLKDYPL